MIRYNCCILFILFSGCLKAQKNDYFELSMDSLERVINRYQIGRDTIHYVYFNVKNITNDTIYYVTNSCFYYNHYEMKTKYKDFDINPRGGCTCNVTTKHLLAPNESILRKESIFAHGLEELQPGELEVSFSIPLIEDTPNQFRVYAYNSVKNTFCLDYDGTIKVVSTTIDNRKKKKKLLNA